MLAIIRHMTYSIDCILPPPILVLDTTIENGTLSDSVSVTDTLGWLLRSNGLLVAVSVALIVMNEPEAICLWYVIRYPVGNWNNNQITRLVSYSQRE